MKIRIAVPIAICGSETWSVRERDHGTKIERAEMKFHLGITGYTGTDQERNK
jgi:hypothetical protein